MPVTSTYEEVATLLKGLIEDEFAAEGFKVVFDKLHESLGERRVEIGVFPVEDITRSDNAMVQETTLELRFLGLWSKKVDPTQLVNPTLVTTYAERFRRKLQETEGLVTAPSGRAWFFLLNRVWYPDDPTGNKTRFYATIRVLGNNSSVVETIG